MITGCNRDLGPASRKVSSQHKAQSSRSAGDEYRFINEVEAMVPQSSERADASSQSQAQHDLSIPFAHCHDLLLGLESSVYLCENYSFHFRKSGSASPIPDCMDTFRNTWRFGVADKVRSDFDRHTTSVKHIRAKLLRHRRERKG